MEGLYVFAQPAFRVMDLAIRQEHYVDIVWRLVWWKSRR